MRKSRLLVAMSAAVLGASFGGNVAFAQQQQLEIEEVITLGSRAKPRSATDSPAPVDVFSADDLLNQGGTDVSDLIRNVVPSYNVNDQPISDAATLVRPANLRGLAPDHTLLLVNGKRRHRASVITWLGNGISNGSQGPDLSAIPAGAIKSIEVLRDGAAAQYGSDAIAGVMNFSLRDDAEGGAIDFRHGEYSEGAGDGATSTLSVNKGFALGADGYLNVTGEYSYAQPTDRAVQRGDAVALNAAGYSIADPAMVWGTPDVDDDIKLWANFGIMLSDDVEVYGYANHNDKTVEGGFYFRNPTNRGGVYSSDGGDTLLVGDLTADGSGNCSNIPITDLVPDAAQFAAVSADPDCFTFQEILPNGFTPRFGGDVSDNAFLLGVKGEAGDLTWDVSAYYGKHESDFFIKNTINASLGPNTPFAFDPGAYEQQDTNFNADFTYLATDQLALAFGAEYRTEEFTIVPGQRESYIDGGLGDQGFSTSSNGFPGFSPQISGSWDRSNYAVYLDGEYEVNDALLLSGAVRFEDFDDFGTTTNYKAGANYTVTDGFGFRATLSTGFKAPTPGQSNASNVSTQNVNGMLVNQGTIPSTSAVAQTAGGRPLEPEESFNHTFGVFFNTGAIDITIDYFDITVNNRLNQSQDNTLTDADRARLAAEGVPGVNDIAEFRFFTNDFNTSTEGVDIVASTDVDWLEGTTTFTAAYNYTKTEVTGFNPTTVNASRIRLIEDGTPDTRYNLTANHQMDKVRLLARASYYGDFFDNEAGGVFDDAMLFDLEAGYSLTDSSTVIVGGRNLFDEKGCTVDECSTSARTDLGNVYSQFSPFGFNGTFYYVRYNYTF